MHARTSPRIYAMTEIERFIDQQTHDEFDAVNNGVTSRTFAHGHRAWYN
ncbi:MAG TPA: hypothetical protein PKD64_13160 [Pirellulaceae bacterium]|nr:hypothetical protein [Pirellulaceae bacterium]HMO93135.1 hypothetical protein [Pirellulaceae bacterium]HMP70306.1 hypothetical protein [Pirellulaceae bacterium]